MNNDELLYKQKYLKYKQKYLELKNKYGGSALLAKSLLSSAAKVVASTGAEAAIKKAQEVCVETANKALTKATDIHTKALLHCGKDQKCIDEANKTLASAKELHKNVTSTGTSIVSSNINNINNINCEKIANTARTKAKESIAKV